MRREPASVPSLAHQLWSWLDKGRLGADGDLRSRRARRPALASASRSAWACKSASRALPNSW
jgi:hypothetical protein